MKEKKRYGYRSNAFNRLIGGIVWLLYPKIKVEGLENLPKEEVVYVANHSKANGPIISQLYMPRECYTWCISNMMNIKEVPGYSFKDFWSQKPGWTHPFYRLASYLIAPVAAYVFSHGDTIPVYSGRNIMKTFALSIDKLKQGTDLLIFPECLQPHNNIVNDFQTGFVELARLYYKRTGKNLAFVPMYICPNLKKVIIGNSIYYNASADSKAEQTRICKELMDSISEMAYSQPRHRVVTYNNISKKFYPENVRENENKND